MGRIIQPGRTGVSGAEAVNMIIQQLNAFAREINIINIRMQVFQNILISKNVATVPELEAEWNKLMEEARKLALGAKLVDADGRPMPAPGPVAGTDSATPAGGTGETGPVDQTPEPAAKGQN